MFGFSHGKNPENRKIFEKWAYFSRKILKNGYPFLPKLPLKMDRGFEAEQHTPVQLKSEYPPRGSAPPSQKEKMVKISHFWQIFGFFPPQKRILPPRCPPQKISSAATATCFKILKHFQLLSFPSAEQSKIWILAKKLRTARLILTFA